MANSIYDFEVTNNSGESIALSDYKDQALLIVNTASACGFTPQYAGLEKLYKKYKTLGLTILAFPCNQFGKQEKGSDEEIKSFCDLTFNISFPIMQKIDVNGEKEDPLYRYLKSEAKGILGTSNIKWNFTKFLINKKGEVVNRFSPTTKPEQLDNDIQQALK